MLQKPEISAGPMGHLARMQTSYTYIQNEKYRTLYMAPGEGGGALPYMGYIGMCRCEGYGFQAVYSRIGYIN